MEADVMSEDDTTKSNRKRPVLPLNTNASVAEGKGMNVGDILHQFQQGKQPFPSMPPSPPVKRDPKRSKMALAEGSKEVGNVHNSSESVGLQGGTAEINESPKLELSRSGQCLYNQGNS
jgi:hypothetical protein